MVKEQKSDMEERINKLPYIIAVDFDGTLVTNEFPNMGKIIPIMWEKVVQAKLSGNKIILWTSRNDKALDEAVELCCNNGLVFDAINKNIPEVIELFKNDTRKVYADEYWDDKAINVKELIAINHPVYEEDI